MSSLSDIVVVSILLVIAVYDAREHRIPNNWLALLSVFVLIDKFISQSFHGSAIQLSGDLSIGAVYFLFGLVMYFMNSMAPGDVKLLGVYGFLSGNKSVLTNLYFLGLAMVIVGCLYLAHAKSGVTCEPLASRVKNYFSQIPVRPLSVYLFLRSLLTENLNIDKQSKVINRMPFAPAVVIGYTLYRYYGG